MKIAFVEPHLELYGGIRRVMELSNRLVRLGEDVTIYHPGGGPCEWMHGEAPTKPLDQLLDEHYDVVLFNDPPDYPHVRKAKASLKVFYILCLYERDKLKHFNPKIFWPKKGRMMALKRALQMPFLKIANATWMQTYLRDELGMESELLIGGVNRDVFHPRDIEKKESELRILWSGDPRERKGGETVLPAFEIIKRRHPHAVLDSYHGMNIPQAGMAEVYSRADVFVDAQWYAGWNNPVAEAMACGVPVVCTDIGGVADFAIHEETALLVPVRNAEAVAAAVFRLADEPGLRDRLKTKAINKIAQFDWDDAAARLQGILRERVR